MRGCSGSGKSSLAAVLKSSKGVVCSTDDFFVNNGHYKYDRFELPKAHEWNKERVDWYMKKVSSCWGRRWASFLGVCSMICVRR